MLISVNLKFPCCGRQSRRFVSATLPCAKYFTVHHKQLVTSCPISHNIIVNISWNKSRTILKAKVKWLKKEAYNAWPIRYPLLTSNKTYTI
jgi:hypothetical protein